MCATVVCPRASTISASRSVPVHGGMFLLHRHLDLDRPGKWGARAETLPGPAEARLAPARRPPVTHPLGEDLRCVLGLFLVGLGSMTLGVERQIGRAPCKGTGCV